MFVYLRACLPVRLCFFPVSVCFCWVVWLVGLRMCGCVHVFVCVCICSVLCTRARVCMCDYSWYYCTTNVIYLLTCPFSPKVHPPAVPFTDHTRATWTTNHGLYWHVINSQQIGDFSDSRLLIGWRATLTAAGRARTSPSSRLTNALRPPCRWVTGRWVAGGQGGGGHSVCCSADFSDVSCFLIRGNPWGIQIIYITMVMLTLIIVRW